MRPCEGWLEDFSDRLAHQAGWPRAIEPRKCHRRTAGIDDRLGQDIAGLVGLEPLDAQTLEQLTPANAWQKATDEERRAPTKQAQPQQVLQVGGLEQGVADELMTR